MTNIIRLGYVGCGAVVEKSHLPAITTVPSMTPNALIDFNASQRQKLGEYYGIPHRAQQFDDVLEHIDLAVIATPSASHFQIGEALLKAGKHVLMEKPLAIHGSEAEQLVALAEESELVLAVSLVRRYLPHFRLFRSLLLNDIVGQVDSFSIEEGAVFNWPVQSSAFYHPEKSGGGVLMDNGAHLLDLILWWLGDYQSVIYTDDAQGGVEAECHLQLTMASGAIGQVTMSRLRKLKNSITVTGDKGNISMDLASGAITLSLANGLVDLAGYASLEGPQTAMMTIDLFAAQYHDLAHAIHHQGNVESGLVLGRDCLRSIHLMEECYRHRQPLPYCAA